MNTYIALYQAPAHILKEWMSTPEEDRKAAEEKMKIEWQEWATKYQEAVLDTAGTGKTLKLTKDGMSDSHNDIMLYSLIEAESYEAVAKILENHPHFGIPEASIEVMQTNTLPGMR